MDNDSVGIDMIDNRIGIGLGTSSENDDIKVFTKSLQNFLTKRPNFNKPISNSTLKRTIRNLDLKIRRNILIGMNERLIHIEHNCFPIYK